jgi:predicted RNase H-like nuclease
VIAPGKFPFAGLDGCKTGWIAVTCSPAGGLAVAVVGQVAPFLRQLGAAGIVAVDMPIGLPERIGPGGRGPENLVRPLLGMRQSSVFSIPSRPAVFATDYREACRIALETSEPPRKISKQAFFLFAKIRELDAALTPEMPLQVIESHPEVAFWRMNGCRPLETPKKVKGAIHPAGMAQRRDLLEKAGIPGAFLARKPPQGAGADDFLDACACLVTASKHAAGKSWSYPETPAKDSRGLQIAIHA